MHACNVLCHMKTLSVFPFLCQSTSTRRDDIVKRLDNIEQKLQLSQTSTSLVAFRQPPARFVNCTFVEVHIPADMAMRHPAMQGLGMRMGRRQPTRSTYYYDSDDSDSGDW